MCGVAGIVGPGIDPAAAEAAVESMLRAQRHRGPDEQGTAAASGAVLGTARLAVIDTLSSKQPMSSPDGRYTLCFNGEVLNYPELRRHPAIRDWRFSTSGDTEVVLALLSRLGPAALPLFNGQFAGGLWDVERCRLMLFRDRFGILPLYYAELPEGVAFASTIRALMQLAPVDVSLDPVALSDLFGLWAPHPPTSVCLGVKQLPPACWASICDGAVDAHHYWEPEFEDRGEDDERELLLTLQQAVDRSLRADAPVGSLISGGLDSTLLTMLAAAQGPNRPSFSVAFEDPLHDESPHQEHVVAAAATDHGRVLCSPHGLARVLPEAVAHAETPFLRLAPCSTYLLGALVHEAGVKAVISGEGADELFCGYDLFRELGARKQSLRARRLEAAGVGGTPAERVPAEVLSLLMEAGGNEKFPAHQLRWNAGRQLRGYLSPELRDELDDPAERLATTLPSQFSSWSELARAQYVEIRTLLPDYILGTQGERMLMAHSVEARIPFLDNEVVALALRLADAAKVRGSSEKDILRRAARGLVPTQVLARRKQAYRAPVAEVLRTSAAAPAREALTADALRAHDVFDASKVERLLQRLDSGAALSGTQEMALAGIVTTQLWLDFVARRRRDEKEVLA
ncbi:MAG TPA: asparagine synthase (glutamine-hydrolyzing) [Solirubrobacterales bacterium]|nr:asparagine synthase (glutamine-hydrolyzing) [Solirubrobacterales bacterium]